MRYAWLLSLFFILSVDAQVAQAQVTTKLPTKLPGKKPAPRVAQGAEKGQSSRVPINARSAVRIRFTAKAWNKSATAADSGSLLMREGSGGRVVQIHLTENGPDTGVFSGLYQINWQNLEKLVVEFYVPQQEALKTTSGIARVALQIKNQEIRRSPFILQRSPSGEQSVEIFETREEAIIAMETHRQALQLRAQQVEAGRLQQVQPKTLPTNQEMEVAGLDAKERMRIALLRESEDRVRLEQLENQRIAELQAKEKLMSEQQKEQNRKDAADLARLAMDDYRAERYKEAVERFNRAVDLDPDNKSYAFQYGVALYKSENFNRSIVFLRMAEGPGVNLVEREFFIGLNFFRKREYENAIKSFDNVIAANNAEMSPASLFYKGQIFFEQQKWDDAQTAYQQVLDTSKDPQLDKRAEAQIEQLLRIKQFEEERKRKWMFSATFGELYDSNVTLLSDSTLSQGSASNVAGYRSILSGSGRYRPVYNEKTEFAAQVDLTTMYTVDTALKTQETFRNADPTVVGVSLPYTYKGLLFGKGYKLDLTPGFESIWMSAEENTNKEIIQSYVFNASNLLVLTDRLFSSFNLETRQDNSKLTSSVGDDNSTAFKVKIANSNMMFLSEDKSRIGIGDVGLTLNQALGRNASYNRIDIGIGYIRPWLWETTANLRLGYFMLNYNQNTNGRVDNSYTLTAGTSKKLSEKLSAGFLMNYNINSSNVEASRYSKWTGMLTLSTQTAF